MVSCAMNITVRQSAKALGRAKATANNDARPTHRRDPSEDVGVEREVVFRDVEAPLDEDLALQGAAVVCES